MRLLTRWVLKRYRPLAAAVLALAVAVPVLVVTLGAGSPDAINLVGVSPASLAEAGVTLTAPQPGDRPLLSAEEAQAVANFHGLQVIQVLLARVSNDHQVPPVKDRLAWVFSFDVTNFDLPAGPPPPPEGRPSLRWLYLIAAVDAETGQLLEDVGAGGPVAGEPWLTPGPSPAGQPAPSAPTP